MESQVPTRLRLKISAKVAPVLAKQAPRELQMSAAQGALPLSGRDLLTVLFLFCSGKDDELRKTAAATLKNLSLSFLEQVLSEVDLDPHLLDFVARIRGHETLLTAQVINHPAVRGATLLHLARSSSGPVLQLLVARSADLKQHCPQLVESIADNPHATEELMSQLLKESPRQVNPGEKAVSQDGKSDPVAQNAIPEDALDKQETGDGSDEEKISKYQLSLNLSVAEKIKMGASGDKEWRALLIKDANKLVQGAVMKNPRITDPEVIAVARNKQSSDEMIRLILLNKDWMKLYEVKRALTWHPKTPLPKALRMLPFLTLKDLKEMARSRNVQTVLATAARKEIEHKSKRS